MQEEFQLTWQYKTNQNLIQNQSMQNKKIKYLQVKFLNKKVSDIQYFDENDNSQQDSQNLFEIKLTDGDDIVNINAYDQAEGIEIIELHTAKGQSYQFQQEINIEKEDLNMESFNSQGSVLRYLNYQKEGDIICYIEFYFGPTIQENKKTQQQQQNIKQKQNQEEEEEEKKTNEGVEQEGFQEEKKGKEIDFFQSQIDIYKKQINQSERCFSDIQKYDQAFKQQISDISVRTKCTKQLQILLPNKINVLNTDLQTKYASLHKILTQIDNLKHKLQQNIQKLKNQYQSYAQSFQAIVQRVMPFLQEKSTLSYDPKIIEHQLTSLTSLLNKLRDAWDQFDQFKAQVEVLIQQFQEESQIESDLSLTPAGKEYTINQKKIGERQENIKKLESDFEEFKKVKISQKQSKQEAVRLNKKTKISLKQTLKTKNQLKQSLIQNKEELEKLLQQSRVKYQQISSKQHESIDEEIEDLQKKQRQLEDKLSNQFQNNMELISQKFSAKIHEIDDVKENFNTYHIIFMIDESGSMSGEWNNVCQCFNTFIQQRREISEEDKVSVILFDSKARVIRKKASIKDIVDLPKLNGGGTNFDEAFTLAEEVLGLTPQNYQPLIIFLTDGDASPQKSYQITKSMYDSYRQKKFILFVIGFGTGCNKDVLKNIAKSGNGGRLYYQEHKLDEQLSTFYESETSAQLQKDFELITSFVVKRKQQLLNHVNVLKKLQEEEQKSATQVIKEQRELLKTQLEFLQKKKVLFQEGNKQSQDLYQAQIQEQLRKVDENITQAENQIEKIEEQIAKKDVSIETNKDYQEKKKNENTNNDVLFQEDSDIQEKQKKCNDDILKEQQMLDSLKGQLDTLEQNNLKLFQQTGFQSVGAGKQFLDSKDKISHLLQTYIMFSDTCQDEISQFEENIKQFMSDLQNPDYILKTYDESAILSSFFNYYEKLLGGQKLDAGNPIKSMKNICMYLLKEEKQIKNLEDQITKLFASQDFSIRDIYSKSDEEYKDLEKKQLKKYLSKLNDQKDRQEKDFKNLEQKLEKIDDKVDSSYDEEKNKAKQEQCEIKQQVKTMQKQVDEFEEQIEASKEVFLTIFKTIRGAFELVFKESQKNLIKIQIKSSFQGQQSVMVPLLDKIVKSYSEKSVLQLNS